MKYYTISFPGEFGQHVVETWSEDQILSSYLKYWSLRMVEAKRPAEEMTRENCIEDWKAVYWAIETDQWGNTFVGQEA